MAPTLTQHCESCGREVYESNDRRVNAANRHVVAWALFVAPGSAKDGTHHYCATCWREGVA